MASQAGGCQLRGFIATPDSQQLETSLTLSVFELAFSSAALYCALYIVWVAQLQTIFPGRNCASRGGAAFGFVCILGDPSPGGDLPSIHKCLLLQKLPEHTADKYPAGMLSMPEQREKANRILLQYFQAARYQQHGACR